MEAKELRIGNFINDRGNKTLRIDWFEQDKICQKQFINEFEVHPFIEFFKYLKPIPLTEEWLLKFGFECVDIEGWNDILLYKVENHTTILTINLITKESGLLLNDTHYADLKYIQFVHQLQNLYFSLTGEELKINP